MCSTVGPRRAAVERFMNFVVSPEARESLSEASGIPAAPGARPQK